MKKIRICEVHQQVFVDRNGSEQNPTLSGSAINGSDNTSHGYRIARIRIGLEAAERGYVTAGLKDVLCYDSLQRGKDVEIAPGPQRPIGRQVPTSIWLGAANSHVISFIRHNPRGLIHHHLNCGDLCRLVIQIVAGYPDLRVRIVASMSSTCEEIYRLFSSYGMDVGLATRESQFQCPCRFIVATLGGLSHLDVLCDPTDILLFLESSTAMSERGQLAILGSPYARVFGFQAGRPRLPPSLRDRQMATFGAVKVDVPAPGKKYRPVEAKGFTFSANLSQQITEAHECLSRLVWRYELRNRIVARVALAMAYNDVGAIDSLGLSVPQVDQQPSKSTIVLVANRQHGCELRKRLRNWPILHGDSNSSMGRQRSICDLENCVIATIAGLAHIDLSMVDTIIWAGSGPHAPAISDASLIVPADHDRPLLWIDIVDRHHPLLRYWSQQRREAYEEREWFAHGVDPVVGRIKRFLATRPEITDAV